MSRPGSTLIQPEPEQLYVPLGPPVIVIVVIIIMIMIIIIIILEENRSIMIAKLFAKISTTSVKIS